MVEIASAYISIIPETSKIAPGIKKALGSADAEGARAGKSMSGALGTALKRGAAAGGAAAVAGIGYSMVKGFERLTAIDNAKAKLSGLGNSASDVSKIMDNALASVKGTAFGMGDAASLAGVMVAAGIKPGQELESTLKRVADSAAIAGTDLNDMGQIWGKAAAKGKIDGEIVNQLLERQIPIYDILGKRMGKSAEEVADMVSQGKVSFQDFSDAMQDKVGGAALKMGDTVSGALANVKAALGRLGASALEPFFNKLPSGLGSLTDAIDNLEPKVKSLSEAFASKVFDDWGPKIRDAISGLQDSGVLENTVATFSTLFDTFGQYAPIVESIVGSLARASAALGVSSWQLFLTTLQAASAVLSAIEPVLSTIANFMEAHPALVTAAVAAWAGFKTIPAMVGRVSTAIGGMNAAAMAAGRTFGGTMRQAYAQGAAGATRFTRTAGVAKVATTGLSKAGSGLMGMMGGPWGVAMAAGAAGVMAITSEMQKSKQKAAEFAEAQKAVESTTRDTTVALRESAGAIDDNVVSAMSSQIDAMSDLASKTWANPILTTGVKGLNGALTDLGLTTDDLSRAMAGSNASWDQFIVNMAKANPAVVGFLPQLQQMRTEFQSQRDVASRVTPGVTEFGDALDTLGDKSATAADKLSAIKTAMDALNPQRSKAEAVRDMAEAIEKFNTEAANVGTDAFNQAGEFDKWSQSGRQVTTMLTDLAEKQQNVAATGDKNDIARMNQEIEASLQNLAASTGQPIEKIRELYNSFGGGENIDLMVKLQGAPETVQEIGQIKAAMNSTPDAKYVEFQTGELTQGTLDTLETLGIKVTTMPDGKTIRVDTTGDAGAKLDAVLNTVNTIPAGKAITTTAPGGEGVRALLADMGVKVRTDNHKNILVESPLAPGVKDLLHQIGLEVINRNGKNVIVRANDDDYVNKSHKWTETEYKQIVVQANDLAARTGASLGSMFRADGGITRYANGGIAQLEAYANGGLKQIRKPTSANIYQPQGDGIVFAEEETGGEAYIPLASSKRSRSTSILATVADMFGMALVPKDGTISGLLGGIAGGAVSKLLKKAGADGLTKFADGGFNARQLKALVNGTGASQPLKGAPYVWGGVNWGDCSGAMSALTRAAAGLAPFGGRWSTGSAASDLPAMGFKQGMWKSGYMGVGFYNGGAGGGHTAGTLPDGTNVEMGGSYGGGMVGGSVGANHSQFTDHWYLPVGPGYDQQKTDLLPENLGVDESQTVPDYEPTQSPSASASTSSTAKPTTISGLVGDAAASAVSGQVKDILDVFGINDSPGFLNAYNEYGQAQEKLKQSKEGSQERSTVTDPGTHAPSEGEDTGVSKKEPEAAPPADAVKTALTGVDAVKAAVKRAFNPKGWDIGAPWSATDFIVNKESSWNPTARNASSGAFGLFQFLGSTKDQYLPDENPDPFVQGKAGAKYIGDRYGDPLKAQEFWKANGWYDNGGIAGGVGHMLKNTLKPERVLSPEQTAAFEHGMRNGFSSPELEAKLDALGGDSWRPGVEIHNHMTVSNDRSQMREIDRRNKSLIMQYGGARQ